MKYTVTIQCATTTQVVVEAENEEQAIEFLDKGIPIRTKIENEYKVHQSSKDDLKEEQEAHEDGSLDF